YLVRVSRVVISATILVVAVYSAPEAAPPSIRLMYNINKLSIKIPNMKKLNAKANSPYSKILRRPNLSLSLPKYEADTKLANEKMASILAIGGIDALSSVTVSGMTGIIMLEPK